MVELRWITFFVMLQFAAVSGKSTTYVTVTARDGDEVTLPCNNVIKNQHKCDQTSWLYSQNTGKATEELISLGQIGKSEIAEAKSNRLSVTADCSLVIKNVTRQDAGLYSCRQFNRAGKLQGGDALVDLSVVRIIEDQSHDNSILYCTVFSYECDHTVQWLVDGKNNDVETRQYPCVASMTFPTRHLSQKSKFYKSLKCNVTDKRSGETLLYRVGPRSPREKKDSKDETEGDNILHPSFSLWWRIIIVLVGLAALIAAVVVVNMWMRTEGNQTQREDNAEQNDEDGDEGTVTYENVGEPSVSIRLH
ncbi:uncharacterized protein LOC131990822 isoform X1 [Centropristis striata]|uniref:uncharacterized protein LOC131990822 isoform X1 n=1 Tax=Centropristis striata TaxID=184440 RepID=UPI0027E0103C|nr:uncharacterized protein LOC131990822 isoform X1 [Centropristis striata]